MAPSYRNFTGERSYRTGLRVHYWVGEDFIADLRNVFIMEDIFSFQLREKFTVLVQDIRTSWGRTLSGAGGLSVIAGSEPKAPTAHHLVP